VEAVHEVFPKCCIHFEDWTGVEAVHLLERYCDKYCVYNDDVQGTASITLAGMINASKLKGTKLKDEKYLFLGAGSAGIGLNARRRVREFEFGNQRVSLNQLLRGANSAWHGVKLGQPDWGVASHSIALTVEIRRENMLFHLIFSAYWEALDFELPRSNSAAEIRWRRWIDTALDSPNDIADWKTAESVPGYVYRAESRSVVMLFTNL